MPSIQDQGWTMLKLAQFKELKEKDIDRKYIELILQEVDPNFKVSSTDLLGKCGRYLIGDTLLHIAYAGVSVDALDILIHKDVDLNVKNEEGNTVLHMAFYYYISDSKKIRWNVFVEGSYPSDKRCQFITSILSTQIKNKNTENPSDPDGLTYFHIACATNNVEAVQFYLNIDMSVDQVVTKPTSKQDFKGYTGLHFATQFGCLQVIEILLEHGANGNLEDSKGRIPLYISLERHIAMIDSAEEVYSIEDIEGNKQVIQLLLDSKFIGKFLDLYIASCLCSTTKLENCLTQDIDVNQCLSMNSPSWPGYTALHFAAHVDVDMVKLLMKHGGNIEAKDADGVTSFDLCVERYKAEDIADIISLVPKWKNIVLSDSETKLSDLLLAFEDSDEIQNFLLKSDNNIDLFIPSDSPLWPGFTVLHIGVLLSERKKCKSDYKTLRRAHFHPDLTVITEILKQDADVTVKDHRNWTPVHFAFQLGKVKVLDLLLQYHYRVQNPVDDDNLSHFHIACSAKNEDLVKRFLWNNVDVNIPYKGKNIYSNVSPGSTPLHIALLENEEKIARLLLKFGADLHIPDAYSFTPLHFAMYDHCTAELGNRLFSSPILSDHVVEKVGLSYLHVACFLPNVDAVRKMLDLGVDVNQVVTVKNLDKDSIYWTIWDLKSRNGDTPLHTVMRSLHHGSGDVVGLLIERGGDIFARNAKGESPLENILDHRQDDCLEALVAALKRDVDLRRRVERETGITLLHVACLLDDVDLIKELLDCGADVAAQIPKDKFWGGHSPLHVAYEKLCFPTGNDWIQTLPQVSLLLKAQKNFNVNPTEEYTGISHFHIACHLLDVDVVEKFLEHGVDVNAAIDLFYNADIAGCSPLLLATRTTEWRNSDTVEPSIDSAKLRIVKLLIQHGASVNVEDIDGNTPAHYAAFCSSKTENYLKLLVENGADVNTRNVRGKTPLELLIRKKNLEFKDIRYFIACGCIFNEFTLDTDEGFIALANTTLLHEDMESLLWEAFTNYPDSMRRDCLNRNAIHNLVSTEYYEAHETEVAELVDILMGFDCDVDDQDNLGRTPLHLATRFRNDIGTKAMLLVGADFSLTDNDGKPPFAYIFDPCLCKNSDSSHSEYGHSEMLDVFTIHVRKMEISNLGVDELNEDLHDAVAYRLDPELTYNILRNFRSEFQRMVDIKIEPYSTSLADFMGRADAVFNYSRMSEAKRDAIDAFFNKNKNEFRNKFSNAAGIFQLQYRQAVLRRKLMDPAKYSLSVLARFQVPEVCSDIILRFLENSELKKLIASTTSVGGRYVDAAGHYLFKRKKQF